MSHHELVTTLRPHTKLYSQEARDALGLAFVRAREAAGYPSRPAFSKACGVGVTSLWKLESGKPVSASVYEAAARALPGWSEDTPRDILDGEPAPAAPGPTGQPAPEPEPEVRVTAMTVRVVDDIRKTLAKDGLEMTPEMTLAFLRGVEGQLRSELQVGDRTTEREHTP